MRSLVVVTAGLSVPSSTRLLADRLTKAAVGELAVHGEDVEVRIVELRDLAHELTNSLLTGFPAASLRKALADVRAADGLVAVSPVFNASYSGLFKTFFDVLDMGTDVRALDGTPVLVAATGGTARHSLALDFAMRPLFAYLRADVVPTGVFAATQDWGVTDVDGGLARRIERAGAELAAAVLARPSRQVRGELADPIPFADLLAQQVAREPGGQDREGRQHSGLRPAGPGQ